MRQPIPVTVHGPPPARGVPARRTRPNRSRPLMASPAVTAWLGLLAALVLAALALPARAALPAEVDGQELPSLAPMLEQVLPAVVNIHAQTRVQVRRHPFMDDPFFRFFFDSPGMPRERIQRSLGSGVIVDAERGIVLTNSHVVENADEIAVTLYDGRTFDAEPVGADDETDLAVIRIPPEGLAELPLGDSGRLRVGDFVVAVGNPFGLGQSVTSGIVSALGRHGIGQSGMQDFIQTDAPINRGNSGGALVNLAGELVGINTAILSPSGGNIGIGFAIPASMARSVMEQLVEHGQVRRGTLGLDTQALNPDLARALNLDRERGAVITQVQAGSPAEKAGLKPGDVIIRAGDREIARPQDLRNVLGVLQVDQTVRLTVLRDGHERVVEAKVSAPETIRVGAERLDERLEGAVLGELTGRLAERLDGGVAVVEVERGSRAWGYGLRPGDVIVSVNRARVPDLSRLQKLLEDPPARMLLQVLRGGGALFVLVE